MDVRKLGTGSPAISIVACVHGDEVNGAKAIDRFLTDSPNLQKPVQFIIANEEAKQAGERSIDTDLNRCFPGNPESNQHELSLAPELLEQVRDTKVLDLHSTSSTATPHAFCVHYTLDTIHLIRSTGVETVVDPSHVPNSSGGLTSHSNGVVIECGPKGTPAAVDSAFEILQNFLAANGVIDKEFEYSTDPQLFRIFDRIDYPTEDAELHANNFQIVRVGEVYLTVKGENITAKEDFYPVLASDDQSGAPFVGFKSKNEGRVSERLFRCS